MKTCNDARNNVVFRGQNSQGDHNARDKGRRALRVFLLAPIIAFTLYLIPAVAPTVSSIDHAQALANGQLLTPIMGWSSWNAYFANIDESVIETAADTLVSSDMKSAGYLYVNTDAGWWSGTRDSSGNITVDTSKGPVAWRR